MKKTNLQLLYKSLSEFRYTIEIPKNILEKARYPLLKMLEIESSKQ
jgi:quinolinate synthase